MQDFNYSAAPDVAAAISAAAHGKSRLIAGGTNLVDLMKLDVETPDDVIDINRLPFAAIEETVDGGVRIGAMARNSTVAQHPLIVERYPILSEALLSGASAQLRNMATVGGNLMQRTRCTYFRDIHQACNKRTLASGCGAADGFHRMHAILGTSEHCFATHPSDMSVALTVLDAMIEVRGNAGVRQIPISEFYALPGDTPHIENVLGKDEIITAVDLPALSGAYQSRYRKVRDRESYEFALVSVAAMLALAGNNVATIRLGFGGVATKPWRATEAEQMLTGARPGLDVFRAAADVSLKDAMPRRDNRFKVELLKRTLVRTLAELSGVTQ